jgi:uncharacterized protein (DUF488 family)
MKRPPAASPLYTIGHSTRSLRELIDVLHAFGVTRLVDIRSIPRSHANPQFNTDVLPAALHDAGITYVLLPALGGASLEGQAGGGERECRLEAPTVP